MLPISEMREISTGLTDIKSMMKDKNQLSANKCDNADEMDQFLERQISKILKK